MNSGTAFNPGQMAELITSVNGAVAAALPRVAGKYRDAKAVNRALKDKTAVLVPYIVAAIEDAIDNLMAGTRHPQRVVKISADRDFVAFYGNRRDVDTYAEFYPKALLEQSKCAPVKAGDTFKINEDELGEVMDDEGVKKILPMNNLWDSGVLVAVVPELIESGHLDKKLVYLLYIPELVVKIEWLTRYTHDPFHWLISGWPYYEGKGTPEVDLRRKAGSRVLSLAG